MTLIYLSVGFIAGAASMAVYNLAHANKLGAAIAAEYQKLKAKV